MPLPGFVATPQPRSVAEAIARVSHDRLKTIAKQAVEKYLRGFLDSTGEHNPTIGSIAKGALTFITDKSVDATQDVTLRTTQLVRLFNEVRQKTPAIVLIDAGMESVPVGLMSGLTHATLQDNQWQGWFCKHFRIPLTIALVTTDQDSTDQLLEVVELCLNNLRQMAGGSEIRSSNPDELWVVRLPLTQGYGATTGENITEDNKDQLWVATIDLGVEAEDTFAIQLPMDVDMTQDMGGAVAQGGRPNAPNLQAQYPPIVEADATMRVGQTYPVVLRQLGPGHKVVIDNPHVATLNLQDRMVTPRQLGTFSLMVLDLRRRQQDGRALVPVVAAQQTVTVVI